MSERVHVVEDGVERSPERQPTRPSWLLGVVGFALGLGLGVLVVSPGPEPTAEPAVTTTISAPETTATSLDSAGPGVATVVPGFPDALVVVARSTSSALEHVLWPLEGEIRVRAMTGGTGVLLDAGSQFIALSETVPGLEGSLLSMGRFNSIQPVVSGVTSYAWHDTERARLAFTQDAGEATLLMTVKADLNPVPVTELVGAGARVVGWGDWGWAIQQSNQIVLLNTDGSFKDSELGTAFASHESGWVFAVEEGAAKLVSAGGGVRRIQSDLGVGTVRRAAFSPDAYRVAVVGSTGVAILDLETDEVSQVMGFATHSVDWSTDSRFLVAAAPLGVAVIDLEDPVAGYSLLEPYAALAVGVLPLRSS